MKNKDVKYIFLDFDGVCNSYKEGSYMTNDNETYGPSIEICKRLSNFCIENNVKIIISSNWRRFSKDGKYMFKDNKGYVTNPLEKLYESLGKNLIKGTLPLHRHINKSEALILWIEGDTREDDGIEFDYKKDSWVVLDDDRREGFAFTTDYNINEHYIETDAEFGITEEIISKIKEKLNIG